MKELKHLRFIYDRMVNVHKESENVDYMIKFKEIIKEDAEQERTCGMPDCPVCTGKSLETGKQEGRE